VAYRANLPSDESLPSPPEAPRVEWIHRALLVAEGCRDLRVEPEWPWTLVDRFGTAILTGRMPGPRCGGVLQRAAFIAAGPQARLPRRMATEMWISRYFTEGQLAVWFAEHEYFGRGAFGLEVASRVYFHARPEQLMVSKAALLLGLPVAPTRVDPVQHPDAARRRRSAVLRAWIEARLVTPEEASEAAAAPLIDRAP
jgi:hypothetical protein